jgi:DNA processing protein
MNEELLYWLALTRVPGVGNMNGRALVNFAGSAKKVFELPAGKLQRVSGVGEKTVRALKSGKDLEWAEAELTFAQKESIHIITLNDDAYPAKLKECPDAPLVLYYKGTANLNVGYSLAVIGTRKMTAYGKSVCEKIIGGLAGYHVQIVSGLAYGVDICAHRAALENGLLTLAVLAHGLDTIYPAQHKATAAKMAETGGLLSEYPGGTLPDKQNFPKRNRIVAGMCDATLVIESAEEGGAMITAALAAGYHREVLAVPGMVSSQYSRGCNALIRNQVAQLVESAEDIIKMMGWDQLESILPKQAKLPLGLDEGEMVLYRFIEVSGEVGIDALLYHSGLDPGSLAAMLLSMECKGALRNLPGKRYAPA